MPLCIGIKDPQWEPMSNDPLSGCGMASSSLRAETHRRGISIHLSRSMMLKNLGQNVAAASEEMTLPLRSGPALHISHVSND